MRKTVSIFIVVFVMGIGVIMAQASERIPAEHFRPNHVNARQPHNSCPQGYSRLFGRNPPTCYQNCPQGWSVRSNPTSGAVCVRYRRVGFPRMAVLPVPIGVKKAPAAYGVRINLYRWFHKPSFITLNVVLIVFQKRIKHLRENKKGVNQTG